MFGDCLQSGSSNLIPAMNPAVHGSDLVRSREEV